MNINITIFIGSHSNIHFISYHTYVHCVQKIKKNLCPSVCSIDIVHMSSYRQSIFCSSFNQYFCRFTRLMSVAPLSQIPAAGQIINIHQLMVEVKKYKPNFWSAQGAKDCRLSNYICKFNVGLDLLPSFAFHCEQENFTFHFL